MLTCLFSSIRLMIYFYILIWSGTKFQNTFKKSEILNNLEPYSRKLFSGTNIAETNTIKFISTIEKAVLNSWKLSLSSYMSTHVKMFKLAKRTTPRSLGQCFLSQIPWFCNTDTNYTPNLCHHKCAPLVTRNIKQK